MPCPCLSRRLILPPVATILLLQGCVAAGLVGREQHLLRLVTVLESACPSAQMVSRCLALRQHAMHR
jgi:hypothetical protein